VRYDNKVKYNNIINQPGQEILNARKHNVSEAGPVSVFR
jgi:hypothetical protein